MHPRSVTMIPAVYYIVLVVIGLVTGSVTGLVGASAIALLVPLLIIIYKIPVHFALGISLFVDFFASVSVSANFIKNKNVNFKKGLFLAIGAVAGSQLGAIWAHLVSGGTLGWGIGVANIVFGLSMLIRSIINLKKKSKIEPKTEVDFLIDPLPSLENDQTAITPTIADRESEIEVELKEDSQVLEPESKIKVFFGKLWVQIITTLLLGFGIGILCGLSGAGGGFLFLFTLISVLREPLHKAIGTSTLVMSVTALSAFIQFAVQGSIDYVMGAILAVCAAASGFLSAKFANSVNEDKLRFIVSFILISLGIALLIVGAQ